MSLIKKIRQNINKNIKMLFVVILVTVGALGLVLLLLSGNQERNSVPVDPEESSLSQAQTTEPQELEGVSERAQELFASRVNSIESIGEVAALLELLDLRKSIGEYTVEVETTTGAKTMVIAFDKSVTEGQKDNLNKRMQEKAQLILALVVDAEEVQWTYRVKTKDKKEEIVADSYTVKSGSPSGASDIKELGQSAKNVDKLLKLQEVDGI